MDPSDDLLASAHRVAQQLSALPSAHVLGPGSPIQSSELSSLIERSPSRADVSDGISSLQKEALDCLDRAPHPAWSLARVAFELAQLAGDERAQAGTALALAVTLNRLGEFRDALSISRRAHAHFAQWCDSENVARSLCQAAWAEAFLGQLGEAQQDLQQVRGVTTCVEYIARSDWIESRILRDQGNNTEAETLLHKAHNAFTSENLGLEAQRCWRELAGMSVRAERPEGFTILRDLREDFQAVGCLLDAALCDLLSAIGYIEVGHYVDALSPLLMARQECVRLKTGFFTAKCEQELGIVYRHLNRYDESVLACQKARDYFLAKGILGELSACDINLGNTYYMLNRYEEALAQYQHALDFASAERRGSRVARLYINSGLVLTKQGRFAQAFDLFNRALQIANTKESPALAFAARMGLVKCHRELGQIDQALIHLQALKQDSMQHGRRESLAQCNIDLAGLQLACGRTEEAVTCLTEARDIAGADGLETYVAICDRLLAEATVATADRSTLLARIENARTLLLKHCQVVDLALVDLTEGELALHWNELTAAQKSFERAKTILSPAFPDQAWRSDYGLGRCAATRGNRRAALGHYLSAVSTVAATRSVLVTEQLSNDYFAHRQSVFDVALGTAVKQDAPEAALEIIEASKALTFLTVLHQRSWRLPRASEDPYIADLIEREKQLRYRLDTMRARMALQIPDAGEPLRGGTEPVSPFELQQLNDLSRVYESVVSQLRLATSTLAGASAPAPFALETFRVAANAVFGSDWTALDYYLSDKSLTVVIVHPARLQIVRRKLTPYDCAILAKCAEGEPDLRELIYRGTLHGRPVPSPAMRYLQHLQHLLIPRDLAATNLIISPHRSLQALPFHALHDGSTYLIEGRTPIYTPSLQIMQLLLPSWRHEPVSRPLIVGLSQFGKRARTLESSADEVEYVRRAFDSRGTTLWQSDATRQKFLELDAAEELRRFDLVHLSTHAVFDGMSPHQSRVLLHDDNLTALDILELTLNARLVTLSACQTALGKHGRGDEMLRLARAFMYAGARSLLASLWSVEDGSAGELMRRFYEHLAKGSTAALALRQSQVEMLQEGRPAYQWAPFLLIGPA